MKQNWPVIIVLLAILFGLLAAGFINKSKGEDHGRQGCFDGEVTLPDFVVLKACSRVKIPTTEEYKRAQDANPLVGKIYSIRKAMIIAISDIEERDDCVQVAFSNGKAFVHGSVEEVTLRVQPGFVEYGGCGPSVNQFMKHLEGEIIIQRGLREIIRQRKGKTDE